MYVRTDLAMEERELWQRSARRQTQLSGVRAREEEHHGVRTTVVEILDEQGQRQLRKPIGTYVTLELGAIGRREKHAFERCSQALAAQIRKLAPKANNILVVGLGNELVTPDAVGPLTLRSLIVTRHLQNSGAKWCGGFGCVSTVEPGVFGVTGIESLELVRGAAALVQPDQIIAVDALATADPGRICSTVQLTDGGIVPGSGVGSSRAAFNRQTLGVPVLAIGVPTVVEAASLAAESASQRDLSGMIVMPRDMDARIREISRLIGYGLNLALHRQLRFDDIACFLP